MKITYITTFDETGQLKIGRNEIELPSVLAMKMPALLFRHGGEKVYGGYIEVQSVRTSLVFELVKTIMDYYNHQATLNYQRRNLVNPTEHLLMAALKHLEYCHEDGTMRPNTSSYAPDWVQEAWKALDCKPRD
jgi:hypothetical protein